MLLRAHPSNLQPRGQHCGPTARFKHGGRTLHTTEITHLNATTGSFLLKRRTSAAVSWILRSSGRACACYIRDQGVSAGAQKHSP